MKKIVSISIIVLLVISLASCGSRRSSVYGGNNGSGGYTGSSRTSGSVSTPSSIKGKCAVLDFQAGTNVTAEEVEAITYNFRAGFYPSSYKIIETASVNKAIESLGYGKISMTREQLCELGRNLEVNLIVVGTVNKLMDEYSVDVQVVNVSKGTTVASQGDTFQKSNYRAGSKTIAQKLANKL